MSFHRLPNRPRDAAWASSRAQALRQVALARHLSRRAVKRARIESLVLLPVLAGIFVVYRYRRELFPREWDTAVRVVAALAMVSLGWQFARDVGRALGPTLLRRLDPGTAGTVGFLVRLLTMTGAITLALRIAGIRPQALVLGGAATAVVVGLAAQQTLANVIAGTVLLNARSFRVGERIRLQGGGLAGSVEGVVASLGLMYTTLAAGADTIMVPNSVVLSVAVVPLRQPPAVNVRARLRPDSTPIEVEELLKGAITTPIRGSPRITLEEVDGDEVIVRISATPRDPVDGPRLATEVLRAIASEVVSPSH
ncbi:MAG TPA: mechanosensitive ion channel family protein [Solirubrobacteraceae bacterium]|nr:mechanosensitive ion channel family protein [Solirubrobacteraceae bacterium]